MVAGGLDLRTSDAATPRDVFEAWAGPLPGAPRDVARLIRRIDARPRRIAHLTLELERREVVVRWEPIARARPTPPPLARDEVDAWQPPSDLAALSRHVVACPACAAASDRPCARCSGSRTLACWYEIERASRRVVVASSGAQALPWSREPHERAVVACAADGTVLATRAGLDHGRLIDAAARVATVLPALPAADPGERVVARELLVVLLPRAAVTYGLCCAEQTIELLGRRLLAPPRAVDRVLARRARQLQLATGLGAGIAAATLATGAGLALALAATTALGLALAALVAATAARRRPAWACGVLAALVLIAGGTARLVGRPQLAHAGALIAAGDLPAAERELAALGSRRDPRLAAAYAELDLAYVRRTASAIEAEALARRLPGRSPQGAAARQLADQRWLDEAQRALHREPGRIEHLLARLSPAAAAAPPARALRTAADRALAAACLDAGRWVCAVDRLARAADPHDPLVHRAVARLTAAAAAELVRAPDAEPAVRSASLRRARDLFGHAARLAPSMPLLASARAEVDAELHDAELALAERRSAIRAALETAAGR